MSEIRKYLVAVQYQATEISDSKFWAGSEEQAAQIALAQFYDTHTDKCINPVVVNVTEIKP